MLNLNRCCRTTAFFICLLAGSAHAQLGDDVALPELTSDKQEFDSETNSLVASGNAELSHGDLLVQGDTIIFAQNENTLKVRDQVALTQAQFRVVGDFINYNYFERSFLSNDFRLGTYPLYLKGEEVAGTLNHIVVKNGRLYFQDPDPFALNMEADTGTLEDGEYLVMENVTFRFGDVPVFWLPYYEQSIEDDSPIRWSANLGFQNNLGAYWQNELLLRVIPELKVGANIDGYTKRGVLGGPIIEYDWWQDSDNFQRGLLDTGFIYDTGTTSERGVNNLGQQIGHDRNFIEWRHKGEIDGRIDLTSDLNWWSDSWVTRDFRPGLFIDNQIPDNFAEGVYRGDNYLVSLFLRYQPNAWEVVTQRFPEIAFDYLPTEILESTVYQEFNADFVRLEEKDPFGLLPELESNRINLFYQLSRPTKVEDWLVATPVASAMVTNYGITNNNQGNYTRVLGEVGIDLEATMVGTWDYQNEFWGIDGLRHILRPVVQYRYIPNAQAGNSRIPQIDTPAAFETYLVPLELGDRRNVDALYETNAIRVGLQNLLQTRASGGDYGSRDLVEFDIYEEFRFTTAPSQVVNQPGLPPNTVIPAEDTFSDIYTELAINPAYWLRLNFFNRFDPEELTNRQISTRMRIQDGEEWAFVFGNDYVQDLPNTPINQFVFEAEYRINDRNQLSALWRYDANLSELTEQYYGWQTRFANSWNVEFQIGYLQGSVRENDFQFRVQVDLLNF